MLLYLAASLIERVFLVVINAMPVKAAAMINNRRVLMLMPFAVVLLLAFISSNPLKYILFLLWSSYYRLGCIVFASEGLCSGPARCYLLPAKMSKRTPNNFPAQYSESVSNGGFFVGHASSHAPLSVTFGSRGSRRWNVVPGAAGVSLRRNAGRAGRCGRRPHIAAGNSRGCRRC